MHRQIASSVEKRIARALPPFRDYLRVHLTFEDLQRLVAQPEAHRDWVAGLSAVGGVYLIVDSLTGEQYVGSATGTGGLWQRWCDYAKSGHGNNLKLRALCDRGVGHPKAFRFSILETFSRTLSRDEAIILRHSSSDSWWRGRFGSMQIETHFDAVEVKA